MSDDFSAEAAPAPAISLEEVGPSISASLIRTLVPVLVGLVVATAAKANLNLDPEVSTQVVAAVVTGLYYTVVRLLEEKVSPAFGWLLGKAAAPNYA